MGWATYDGALAGAQKQTAKPNGLDILGNHPGVSPSPFCLPHSCLLSSRWLHAPGLADFITCFGLLAFDRLLDSTLSILALEHGLELFLLQNLPLPQRLFDLWLSAPPFPHNQAWSLGAGTRETLNNIQKHFPELDEIAFWNKIENLSSLYTNLISRWSH